MNFLGIGPMELVIVAVLAYFLLGPKKMGEAGKTIGKILREFREQRDEFTSMLMESVDLDDKPKAQPVAAVPSTPVGAVAQSGDPGDSDDPVDSNDSGDSGDSGAEADQPLDSAEATPASDETRATDSDSDPDQKDQEDQEENR